MEIAPICVLPKTVAFCVQFRFLDFKVICSPPALNECDERAAMYSFGGRGTEAPSRAKVKVGRASALCTGYTVRKSALYRHFWFTASSGGGFAKFWS